MKNNIPWNNLPKLTYLLGFVNIKVDSKITGRKFLFFRRIVIEVGHFVFFHSVNFSVFGILFDGIQFFNQVVLDIFDYCFILDPQLFKLLSEIQ